LDALVIAGGQRAIDRGMEAAIIGHTFQEAKWVAVLLPLPVAAQDSDQRRSASRWRKDRIS
jgi:hypothetical protein